MAACLAATQLGNVTLVERCVANANGALTQKEKPSSQASTGGWSGGILQFGNCYDWCRARTGTAGGVCQDKERAKVPPWTWHQVGRALLYVA